MWPPGSKELTLTASLSGGEGGEAWQHAQLFRSKRTGGGEGHQGHQLALRVWLRKE